MSDDPSRWHEPYPPVPPRRRQPSGVSPWVGLLTLVGLLAVILGGAVLVRSWLRAPDDATRYGNPREVEPRGDLMELEKTNIRVYKDALPSVVNVNTSAFRRDIYLRAQEVPRGTGSGFIWDKGGHVVTNYHVISGALG